MYRSEATFNLRDVNKSVQSSVSTFPVLKILARVNGTETSYDKFRELLLCFNNVGLEINIATSIGDYEQEVGAQEAREKSKNVLSDLLDHCRAFNMPCSASIIDSDMSENSFNQHALKTNSHLIFDTTEEPHTDTLLMKTVRDDPIGFKNNGNVLAYLSTVIGRSFVKNITYD